MKFFRLSFLFSFVLAATVVLAACGGGGDDDDDDDGSGSASNSGGDATKPSSGNATQASNSGGDGKGAKLKAIKDGSFEKATVHVDVSGDKDVKFDLQGTGLATDGYTLLTFTSADASVILALQAGDAEEPGGLALTAKDVATAGAWGKDCTVSFDDGSKELKGEFTCKQLDGVTPGSVKSYKIKVTGKFTAER